MTTTTLRVTGMTCGGCEARVVKVLERLDGVETARASHTRDEVVVEHDSSVEPSLLVGKIEKAGFVVET